MEAKTSFKDMSLHKTGIYLYGVARRDTANMPINIEGVQQGEKVELLVTGCLAVAVSRVSLFDFTPAVLEEHLTCGETQWLKEKTLAHAAVLQELMRRGPVLPVRFGTIFKIHTGLKDTDSLLSIMGIQEKKLISLLGELEGKAEWGVRICYLEEVLKESLMEHEPEARLLKESIKSMPEGMAYLYKKRLEMLLENKTQAHLIQWTQQIQDALAEISKDSVKLNNQSQRQGSARIETEILNEAYLVQEKDTERFKEELERLGNLFESRGLRFYISGPWPPYNFAPLRLDVETR